MEQHDDYCANQRHKLHLYMFPRVRWAIAASVKCQLVSYYSDSQPSVANTENELRQRRGPSTQKWVDSRRREYGVRLEKTQGGDSPRFLLWKKRRVVFQWLFFKASVQSVCSPCYWINKIPFTHKLCWCHYNAMKGLLCFYDVCHAPCIKKKNVCLYSASRLRIQIKLEIRNQQRSKSKSRTLLMWYSKALLIIYVWGGYKRIHISRILKRSRLTAGKQNTSMEQDSGT